MGSNLQVVGVRARRTTERAWRCGALLALVPLALACGMNDAEMPVADEPVASALPPPSAARTGPSPAAATVVPTYGRVTPVDDALNDVGFRAFRDTVLRIVAARDTSALLAIVAPDIKNSFGGNDGAVDFRTAWRLGESDSELWGILDDVLRHGGRFTGPDAFVAPYTFMALPDSLDAFEYLMVRDEDVPVYTSPNEQSEIVARLSFDVVRAGPYLAEPAWTAIAIGGDRFGYVQSHRIRSAVDYRLQFARRNGRWMLVFLVAGD
jgi:hypothetical protein